MYHPCVCVCVTWTFSFFRSHQWSWTWSSSNGVPAIYLCFHGDFPHFESITFPTFNRVNISLLLVPHRFCNSRQRESWLFLGSRREGSCQTVGQNGHLLCRWVQTRKVIESHQGFIWVSPETWFHPWNCSKSLWLPCSVPQSLPVSLFNLFANFSTGL